MPDPLARLTAGLAAPPTIPGRMRPPGVAARAAAVLALFTDAPCGPEVVLAERASTLRRHAGQIAFPGGAAESVDTDLVATALREAAEEVALQPGSVEVLGCLPAVHVPISGYDVTTVVGRWRDPHPLRAADPAEVASVHRVPVSTLVSPQVRCTASSDARGYRGPAFALDSAGTELFVWGLTAGLLDLLLELGGWAVPWDAERVRELTPKELR